MNEEENKDPNFKRLTPQQYNAQRKEKDYEGA